MTEHESTRGGLLKQAAKIVQGDIGRKLIVTIGIDAYEHMPVLRNAVGDARGILQFFTESLGFETPLPPLLDDRATKTAITELLEDRLPAEVDEDDAVVLFFAGHGKSRRQTGRERGYLAPVEARQDHWADYIRIREFLNVLDDLRARHVVAILDACHSGFALGQAMVRTRSGELPRYVSDLQRKKSRRVLTSAMADQEALDGGPVPGHSLFTGCLIHGLRAGLADMDGNGVITTSELGEYVRSVVAEESNSEQTPDFGRFAPYNDERGELFFTIEAPPVPEPKPSVEIPSVSPARSPLQDIWEYRQWLQSEDEQMREFARKELRKLAEGDDRIARAARASLKTEQKRPEPDTVLQTPQEASADATPVAEETPPQPDVATCAALTKSGRPCKNHVRKGSDYCYAHRNYAPAGTSSHQRDAIVRETAAEQPEKATTTAAPDSRTRSDSVKCAALTKSGRLCKNHARKGSDYCYAHRNYTPAGARSHQQDAIVREATPERPEKATTATAAPDSRNRSNEQSLVSERPIIHKLGGLEFVEIPAGEFWMGSDDGMSDEKPRHKLYLETYWIGRTPITNAQYRAFVDATGHDIPGHWMEKKYEEREKKGWIFTSKEKILVDEAVKFPEAKADHPVVYVSWHDALAYCRWLSQKTGVEIMLPSEAEWEKAARGPEGLVYPWGNDEDIQRFNRDYGDTTPVDKYPRGASPYGVLDMIGNVLEWTRTIGSHEALYPYEASDGREDLDDVDARRVLRGWSGPRRSSRASDERFNSNGFRVVVRRFPPHHEL